MLLTTETLDESGPLHPLFAHYGGQSGAQPAYLEIDQDDKSIRCDYSGEIGNAVPADVWHGRRIRFSIPHDLTAHEANTLMAEVAPLAEKLIGLYECRWDGSNHAGRYTDPDAAEELKGEIESVCEAAQTCSEGVWYAEQWFSDSSTYPASLTAQTTDEQLAAIIAADTADAQASGATVHGLDEFLTELRDRLRAEVEQ